MKASKAYNYTPRRAKALPIVEHPRLGKCVLISKERNRKDKGTQKRIPGTGNWSLFGGGNEEFIRGGKKYQEDSIDALRRELKEELGDGFNIDRVLDLKESKNGLGEILSDKRGKLKSKGTRDIVKQRIFSVMLSGEVKLKGTDHGELTGIGYYPLGKQYENIRMELEKNMDEFAIEALRKNLVFLRSNNIQSGNVVVKSRKRFNDLDLFESVLGEINKSRGLVSKILGLGKV